MFDEKKCYISHLWSLRPPKKIQKYIVDVFFSAEHDPGIILPLLVQEKVANSKNWKIEKPFYN